MTITRRWRRVAAALLFTMGATPLRAEQVVALSSGPDAVALIELYTSEGCSSCPPADRWLSRLETHPGLWSEFTPIAFHVDYWDYIGWEDRFADEDFSDRQRRYAAEGGARVVYTPGFFVAGEEWRDWRRRDAPELPASSVGELQIEIDGRRVTARFAPASDAAENLTLHIALLGMDLETRVRAGENRGRTLTHDFVALDIASVTLARGENGFAAATTLPGTRDGNRKLAVAAWVTAAGRQAPLQSVGGFLP